MSAAMGVLLNSESSFKVLLSKTTISSSSIYDETEDKELDEAEDERCERSRSDSELEEREVPSDECRPRSLFIRDDPGMTA